MRAIVVGAGKVGFHIARQLTDEASDVVLIDTDEEALRPAQDLLDIMTVQGNGASARVLRQAGADGADLVVAVTEKDEVNVLACLVAKHYGAARTVARVRNPEYTEESRALAHNQLGIDLIINPELLAATSIVRLLRVPTAIEVGYFAGGAVEMIGLRANSPSFVGKTLRELAFRSSLVVALARDDEVVIPRGDTRIENGDLVYLIGQSGDFERTSLLSDRVPSRIRTVTIVGGGETGYAVAHALANGKSTGPSVKVIEKNPARARWLAEHLQNTLVIQGDGSGFDVLEAEQVRGSDALIAATGKDETNMLVAMVAKRLDVRETIIRLDREEYAGIAEAIGVHATVIPRLLTASTILKLLRRGKVQEIAFIQQGRAEVIDVIVSQGAPVTDKPLAQIDFPEGAIVGMLVRGRQAIIPHGSTQVQPGDRAVVFSIHAAVPAVERLLGLE